MKTYKFTLLVEEGNDEFWEELSEKTGCDEVTRLVSMALSEHGFDTSAEYLKLVEFKNG